MGGTERNSLALCKHLAEEGEHVTLVTARPGGPLEASADSLNVQRITIQPFDWKLNWFPPVLSGKIVSLGPEKAILMGRVANEFGWRLKARNPDLELVASIRTGRPFTAAYRRTLNVADSIWVNSQYAADRATEIGISADKMKLVQNYEIHELSYANRMERRDQSRRELGVEDGAPAVFVKVAAFRPGKCHEKLIRIFKRIDDLLAGRHAWQLWLVGSGSEESACRRLVAKLGLGEKVRFFGLQLDVSKYYYAGDCAVSASQEESNSNFIQEARRAGLPVIAFQAGGTSERTRGSNGEVAWASSDDALQESLLEFIKAKYSR